MTRRWLSGLAAVVLVFSGASSAAAQWPGLTANFLTPYAAGSQTDSWDVWVRLTLAADVPAIAFDGTSPATSFGLGSNLPVDGVLTSDGTTSATFASYTSAYMSVFYGCSGDFSTGCGDGPPYYFSFSLLPPVGLSSFNLAPGGNYDFLLGTFTPMGGSVPPGTYKFYYAGALFGVDGLNALGNDMKASIYLPGTCSDGYTDDCAFIRTVEGGPSDVVPEPQTMSLLATGLVGLVAAAGRRRRRA